MSCCKPNCMPGVLDLSHVTLRLGDLKIKKLHDCVLKGVRGGYVGLWIGCGLRVWSVDWDTPCCVRSTELHIPHYGRLAFLHWLIANGACAYSTSHRASGADA